MAKKRKGNTNDELLQELQDLRFENAAMKKQLREINDKVKIDKGKSRKGITACPDCGAALHRISSYKVNDPVFIVTCSNCDYRGVEKRDDD